MNDSTEETNDNEEENFNSSEKSYDSIVSNASTEEIEQGNLFQSQISLTPPPPMTYSSIKNVHLEFAKKVLADGNRIRSTRFSNAYYAHSIHPTNTN